MTLVGYFNSMRELGGMRRLVDDDVRTRLQEDGPAGTGQAMSSTPTTWQELTSPHEARTDIPEILDRLEAASTPTWKPDARKPAKKRQLRGHAPKSRSTCCWRRT